VSQGRRVLVVDDDEDLRNACAEVLEDADCDVLQAGHGRAALDLLRRDRQLPDLILLDMMMPVMDGVTFAAEVRKDARLSAIPIIMFSAHLDCQRAAADAKAVGCLKKPLSVQTLVTAVDTALGRERTRA
jgi:CheY-like chemotaxis protein